MRHLLPVLFNVVLLYGTMLDVPAVTAALLVSLFIWSVLFLYIVVRTREVWENL